MGFLARKGVERLPLSSRRSLPGDLSRKGSRNSRERDAWATISLEAYTFPPGPLLTNFLANLDVRAKTWRGQWLPGNPAYHNALRKLISIGCIRPSYEGNCATTHFLPSGSHSSIKLTMCW